MSKLTLNFFGESISVPKPKDLPSLRRLISVKFFLNESDAEEILYLTLKTTKKFQSQMMKIMKPFTNLK